MAGDMEDSTESVAVFVETVKQFRPDEMSISIEQGDWGVDKVVLHLPRKELSKHLRSIHIQTHIDGQLISKILVNNGAVVNIFPSRILRVLNKDEKDLLYTKSVILQKDHLLQGEFCLCNFRWVIESPQQHFL